MREFLLIALVAFTLPIAAIDYTGDRYIEKGDYVKAWAKIDKALTKDSTNVSNLYGAYAYYVAAANPSLDIESAYYYLEKASHYFSQLDQRNIDKLEKDGLNKVLFGANADSICQLLLTNALEQNQIEPLEHFLSSYALATDKQCAVATDRIYTLAFEAAETINTIDGYQQFLMEYPKAPQVNKAWIHIYDLEWEQTLAENTTAAYEKYIATYPKSKYCKSAQNKIYSLEWEKTQAINKKEAYMRYISTYPNSPFKSLADNRVDWYNYFEQTADGSWQQYATYIRNNPSRQPADSARAILCQLTLESRDYHLMEKTLDGDYLKDTLRTKVLIALHDIYFNANINNSYPFLQQYADECLIPIAEKDQTIIETLAFLNEDYESYDTFIRIAAPYRIAYKALQDLIANPLRQKDFAKALEIVDSFAEAFGDDPDYQMLRKTLEAPKESIVCTTLPASVNATGINQYVPVISADGKTLYFCQRNLSEDIFTSNFAKAWSKAVPMTSINTDWSNEAPMALSVDGTKLIVFRNGTICETSKRSNGWSYPMPLSEIVNMCDWQADVQITADGKAMLFTAKKATPYEIENQMDLYEDGNFAECNIFVSLMGDDGEWQPAIDLGPTINTPYCDRSPFLHPDGKTLYFSSCGHGSLGDLDVFMSTRLSEDSWTQWSEPINLGKEINTASKDWGYKITTDGAHAFFSAVNKNGDEDIVTCNIPKHLRPNLVAIIKGKLKDKNGQSVATEIRWEDLETGREVGRSNSDPEDGSYYMVLPLGKIYGYYVEDSTFFPLSNNIDLRAEEQAIEVANDMEVVTFQEMINDAVPVPMNNLFFDTGRAKLRSTSYSELRRIAKIIIDYNMHVEISGHTDDVGEEDTNQKLSEERAKIVLDYLVSRGCDPTLLKAIGYGETRPIVPNDSELNRQKNRRVEIRFIDE